MSAPANVVRTPAELAAAYAADGVPVFPCGPDKRPLTEHGFKDASTDPEEVRAWWQTHPTALIGMPTGAVTGTVVVDVDVKGGAPGRASFAELQKKVGGLLSRTVRTTTGGDHIYLKHPGVRIKNRQPIPGFPGVDVRGDGGYVILPGSRVNGRAYELTIDEPLADMPAALVELLQEPDKPQPAPPVADTIPQGARNGTLISLAGTLRRRNMTRDAMIAALLAENQARCSPPLPAREVRTIVDSVMRYPAGKTTKPPRGFSCTDTGNSERLIARHGENLRYCHAFGKWLLWDGVRWCFDEQGLIVKLAKDVARGIYDEAAGEQDGDKRSRLAKWAAQSENSARINAMIELSKCELPVAPSELDRDPMLLCVRNGTIDLKTGALRESRRKDMLTKMGCVTYDAAAQCPTWDEFLRTIFDGDAELIAYQQDVAGLCLTGDTSEQCFWINWGGGSNGKSTQIETMSAILGDYAQQTETKTLLDRGHHEGVRNDLAALRGARFVTASEIGHNNRLNEHLVKQLTGGDRISARFLYQEFFEFYPQFKLMVATNNKPKIRGVDWAVWRRVRLVPYVVTIPDDEQDRHLKDKLIAESAGILNWMIAGCLRWQKDGLTTPAVVVAATDDFRAESDILGDFLAECCVFAPNATVPVADLYLAYEAWCATNGEQAVKPRTLSSLLGERGLRNYQKKLNGENKRRWFGLGLLAADYEPGADHVEEIVGMFPEGNGNAR